VPEDNLLGARGSNFLAALVRLGRFLLQSENIDAVWLCRPIELVPKTFSPVAAHLILTSVEVLVCIPHPSNENVLCCHVECKSSNRQLRA